MTDLYSGQLTDLLRNDLRNNPDVVAISYAIQQEKQRLLRLESKTRTLSMIDDLDEAILDVLAVELRIPYYSQGFSLERKRSVVKTAMLWFYKAGTAPGMMMALQAVHGDSSVEEWFQYGGDPGYFQVGINITDPTEVLDLKWLRSVVDAYKPVRAHLEDDGIAFRSAHQFVMGMTTGFVAYEVPRAGTLPGPATVGALAESIVRIRADHGIVGYAAPKTGEAVTGTHPNSSTVGAIVEQSLELADSPGGTAYAAPMTGEAVAGVHPSDATAGAAAASGMRAAITGDGTSYNGPACGDADIL